MILTQCAVCATDLGLSSGKKCGRCSTRYCGPECQVQHWKEGGHDQLCKPIKKAGGAEQYNANKKYAEAVTVAAEECADDTKGQTCYICTQALHWKTKEGLVRGCSCRGTAGFAHVSCLAEQAKILLAEAEENNLGEKAVQERWARWEMCSLCEQDYHGVVAHALGWACWKTYVGRPEDDWAQQLAMTRLGNGLTEADLHEDALAVREAELAMMKRIDAPEHSFLVTQSNLANTYRSLGRLAESMLLRRQIYAQRLKLSGEEHPETIREAICYAVELSDSGRFRDVKALTCKVLPVARRVLGNTHEYTLRIRRMYAFVLYRDDSSTPDDIREAVTTLEDTTRLARRVFGGEHPFTAEFEGSLRNAQAALAARETPRA
jgi:hypothetical protein